MKKTFLIATTLITLTATGIGIVLAENSKHHSKLESAESCACSTAEMDKRIHDYLIENPEVLVEASKVLQQRAEAEQERNTQEAIKENVQELFNPSNSPILGNPDGKITVVEFFDYQCGHCKHMGSITQKAISKDKNIRFVFKELPIFGGASRYAAQAALASAIQGKYAALHDALLKAENPLTEKAVIEIAEKVGLNIDQLKHDMEDPAVTQELDQNNKLAQKLKLMGTPAFIFTNEEKNVFRFIPGAISEKKFQKIITEIAEK